MTIKGNFDFLKTVVPADGGSFIEELPLPGRAKIAIASDNSVIVIDHEGKTHKAANQESVDTLLPKGFERFLLKQRIATSLKVASPYPELVQSHVNFYRDSQGYFSDFIADDHVLRPVSGEPTYTYHLAADGDDGNSGQTPDEPKQNLSVLVALLNETNTSRRIVNLNVAPGFYENAKGFAETSFNFPVNLFADDVVFARTKNLTIPGVTHATYTNSWLCAMSDSTDLFIIDKRYLDLEGNPIRYELKDSLSSVDATAGSFATDSGSVLVRTIDGRKPDADIIAVTSTHAWRQTHAHDFFASGFQIWGGRSPFVCDVAGSKKAVFDRTKFLFGRGYNGTTFEQGSHTAIYNRTVSGLNRDDGFSIRGSVMMMELGTIGYGNGLGTTPDNDNGTTSHGNGKTIRINCRYPYNKDRAVHDVESSISWLMGCQAGLMRSTDTSYTQAAYAFGQSGNNHGTKATLYDCISLGGAVEDLLLLNRNVRVTYTDTNMKAPYLVGSPTLPIATAIPRLR